MSTYTDMITLRTWAEMKAIVEKKRLRYNYGEYSSYYDVRAVDSERFRVILVKGTPDCDDFEANYKAAANAFYGLHQVIVTETGELAISAFGDPMPPGGTAVAAVDGAGKAAALRVTAGALHVCPGGYHIKIPLGATSPGSPLTVPQTAVAVPPNLTEIRVIATLATTDGTPTGGPLSAWLQSSVDGIDWYDWLPLMIDVASGTAAYSIRYADVPSEPGAKSIVRIGKNLLPASRVPSGGPLENWLRVIFVAGAGTNHGVAQTIYLIGRLPA